MTTQGNSRPYDSKIAVKAGQLGALDIIIKRYEQEAIDPANPGKAFTQTFKPMSQLQATVETFLATSAIEGVSKTFDTVLKDGTKTVSEAMSAGAKAVADELAKLYEPGRSVPRQKKLTLGDHATLNVSGTLGGLLNATSAEQVGSILLKDCIPCEIRQQGFAFTVDLGWITKILKELEEIVAFVQTFIRDLFDDGQFEATICANLNLPTFTCLPDLSAMTMALGKGLAIKLKTPRIKLPGLSDLVMAVVAPVMAALANLAQQWVNFIMNPIECVLRSLATQIKKLNIGPKPKENAQAKAALGTSVVKPRGQVPSGVGSVIGGALTASRALAPPQTPATTSGPEVGSVIGGALAASSASPSGPSSSSSSSPPGSGVNPGALAGVLPFQPTLEGDNDLTRTIQELLRTDPEFQQIVATLSGPDITKAIKDIEQGGLSVRSSSAFEASLSGHIEELRKAFGASPSDTESVLSSVPANYLPALEAEAKRRLEEQSKAQEEAQQRLRTLEEARKAMMADALSPSTVPAPKGASPSSSSPSSSSASSSSASGRTPTKAKTKTGVPQRKERTSTSQPLFRTEFEVSEIEIAGAVLRKKTKYDFKLKAPEGLTKAVEGYNKGIQSMVKGLELVQKSLQKVKKDILAFIKKKFVDPFKKLLAAQSKGIKGLMETLKDVKELAQMVLIVGTIKKLFQSKIHGCPKEELFETVKDSVPASLASMSFIPGTKLSAIEPSAYALDFSVPLTKEEVMALGLPVPKTSSPASPPPVVNPLVPPRPLGPGRDEVQALFRQVVTLRDCTSIAPKEHFYNVDTLLP